MNTIACWQEKTGQSLIETGTEEMPLFDILYLILFAFQNGARVAKEDFSMTVADIGDMLDHNPELFDKIMDKYKESQGGATKKGKPNLKASKS